MFQPLIVIYRRGIFLYHLWECASIYRPLSYPWFSLPKTDRAISYDEIKLYSSDSISRKQERKMHTLAEMINIAQRQLENECVKIDPNHMRWLLEKSSLLCDSFLQSLHKSNKISLCVSVCLYLKIVLTAKPIWLFFTV